MRKKISVILLSFIFMLSLDGKVTDFAKKAEGKNPTLNRMKNIDFIYLINLDKRTDKYLKSIRQLEKYGIKPYRFSAICGWDLDYHTINSVGVKFADGMDGVMRASSYPTSNLVREDTNIIEKPGQTYFVHRFSLGALGCALSHISVLKDALDSNYETIWVMEDDIKVLDNPRKISDLIDRLNQVVGKGKWDILFTDRDHKNKQDKYVPCIGFAKRPNFKPELPERFALNENVSHEFRKIGARFGTTSMIISRSGIRKILDFYDTYHIFLPIDMDISQPNDINLFTLRKDIVGNLPDASSNIKHRP